MIAKSLAAFLFLALPLQAKTSIETAYESGELDLATALIYQVQSLRAPDALPMAYRQTPTRALCGTPQLVQAVNAIPQLGADDQRRLGKLV